MPKQIYDIELLSIKEVAALLGVVYLTVERKIAKGELKACRLSKELYVTKENLISYLKGNNKDQESESRGQHPHKKVVSIQHKCIICKEKIDPKNDIFVSYVGNRDLHSCSNEHQNEWKHMTPAEQKKLLSSTKAPASSTAPSNAYRTKIEKFTERDRKRNEAQ